MTSQVVRVPAAKQTVSQLTRRDIFDYLSMEGIAWHGRLEEVVFLERIRDLSSLPAQHPVNNPWDWEDDWIFTDSYFNLMHGPDDEFLQFLCEMVNPWARPDADEAERLVAAFNKKLAADGWVLSATDQVSGRPVFTALRRKGAKQPSSALRIPEYRRLKDPQVFEDHLRRIESGLAADPAAAIASSKEMVESVCKIILDDYEVSYSNKDDLLTLYKNAAKALKLDAESVPDNKRGSKAAQDTLRALVTVVQRLAELRNELGLGHGRTKASQARARHARLAFNTGSAVAEFLLDTWHDRRGDTPS
jgi:hypothetical protein